VKGSAINHNRKEEHGHELPVPHHQRRAAAHSMMIISQYIHHILEDHKLPGDILILTPLQTTRMIPNPYIPVGHVPKVEVGSITMNPNLVSVPPKD